MRAKRWSVAVGAVRALLGVGSGLVLASVALAGPTTTTTISGGTTTTGAVTTTTTAPPTTTTTAGPTTTTTSTSTTTSTTLPQDLTFAFQHNATGSANTSFVRVDIDAAPMCVAGQVQGSSGNNQVTIAYESQGRAVSRLGDKIRGGNFGPVDVTLTISGPPALYQQTITSDCQLRAAVLKVGPRGRVKLRCDFGPDFSAFPGLSVDQAQLIQDAFERQPGVGANARRGRLSVSHAGQPAGQTPVSCSLSD